jgi:hypothetical protein
VKSRDDQATARSPRWRRPHLVLTRDRLLMGLRPARWGLRETIANSGPVVEHGPAGPAPP